MLTSAISASMSVEKNRLRPRALLTTCKRNEQALQVKKLLQHAASSFACEIL
jgi:hypothetical protein